MCLTETLCLDGADIITFLGILISLVLGVWSLIWNGRLAKRQNQIGEEQNALLAEQNEIARRQLESPPPKPNLAYTHMPDPVPRPYFRVALTSAGRSERLVIRNVGDAPANQVTIQIDPPDDLVGGSPQDFPRLDPGQDWRLIFARAMGSPDRYQWTITWVEPSGNTKEQTGWISPP